MAEPARRLDDEQPEGVYDQPGTAPSAPKPDLKALEGGGETSAPKRGHLSEAGAEKPEHENLSTAEESAALPQHENQLGHGYRPGQPLRNRFTLNGRLNRRRTLIGGGILGGVIGSVIGFSVLQGPFQFIHLAQLLQQFHFSSIQNEEDDRFVKEVRLFRYASKGQLERTRMGFLGNKFGDYYEKQLNASGLISAYSDIFGRFNGYIIDTVSEESPFHGMTDPDEIAAKSEELFGVKPVMGSEIKGISAAAKDKWVIPSKTGFTDNIKLNFGLLNAAGKNKLSSAIGARLLCERAACTSLLHPLSELTGNAKDSIEEWWKARNNTDQSGSQPGEFTPEDETPDKSGSPIGETITAEESNPKSAAEIGKDLGAKGAAALGFLCIARSIAKEGSSLKASQVDVLIRMGMEAMAIGSQLQSGQDVNLNQLSQYSKLLNGTDSSGKDTNWDQSESIQANLGNTDAAGTVRPDQTLQDVTNDRTPFDFLLSGVVGTALSGVCGTVGSIIQIVAGGLEGAVQGLVFGAVFQASGLATDLANWLAGQAINVDAVGADYGNEVDYGAALAANDQSMAAGGVDLTNEQAAQLQSADNLAWQDEFNQSSTMHKLLSPTDDRSFLSQLIDNTSPSFTQNLNKVATVFLNFGKIFSSFPRIFTGTSQVAAAGTGWNYGFPTMGFSASDLDNPLVQNPYQNAADVESLFEETGGLNSPYISKAKSCFGVTISQVPIQIGQSQVQQWDVTSQQGDAPRYTNIPSGCSSDNDTHWLQVRFFILDTETMNSMGCYAGDDQACSDIGLTSDSSGGGATTSGETGSLPQGTSQQLAQQLLPYIASSKIKCGSAAGGTGAANCQDIQNTAKGVPVGGNCAVNAITPHLLGLILGLVRDDGWTLGISAMCSNHSVESDGAYGGHTYGSAADFSIQNGASGAAAAADEKFVDDAAALLSSVGGSFGQVQCHSDYPALDNSIFTTFDDTCNHQHIRAAP